MADNDLTKVGEAEQLDRRALYVSLATAVFMVILWIISLAFAPTRSFSLGRDVGLAILTAASFLSAGLARYGRSHYGIWLIVLALYTVALWTTWINSAGLGPAIAMMSLLISSGIITYTLPRKYVNPTIVAAVVGTLLTIIGDIYSPIERPLTGNAQVITILTFVTLVVYGIFILRQFRFYTLRTKMIMLFVGISVLSVAIVGNVVSFLVREALTVQVSTNLTQQSEKLSDFLGAVFVQKVGQIQALAVVDSIRDDLVRRNATYSGDEAAILATLRQLDSNWVTAEDDDPLIVGMTSENELINPTASQLYDFLRAFPDHPEIFVTDRYGGALGATYRILDYYQADEEWWQAAWNNGEGSVYLSDPRYDEGVDAVAIQIALPIFGEIDNEIVGIIRSTLILDDLFDVVEDVRIGETGHGVLLDSNSNVLFESVIGEGEGTQGMALEVRQSFLGEVPNSEIIEDEQGDLSVFTYAPVHVEGFAPYGLLEAFGGDGETEELGEFETAVAEAVAQLNWTIVLRQKADEAFATVTEVTNAITLASLVVVLLVGVMAAFFANSLTRPIRALGTAAAAIAEGNLNVPLPAAGGDEIGQLTTEFANMTQQLQRTVGELQQRTLVIETSSEVSRHLSTILNEQELVTAVVNQVQRSFSYYHAHIYLMNEQGNRLQMMGGTGHAGQEMLNRKHSIRVGTGLVGRAAASKLPVLVSDVHYDPNWLPNPLLPDTKSEVAIPIMRSDQVLGVLDVQHDVINGLQQQDVEMLNLIANQVAVALQNARSYTQAQRQANQQALINEIGQRLQTATTIERTLQIAAEELGQALGTQRTTIQLNSDKQTNGR